MKPIIASTIVACVLALGACGGIISEMHGIPIVDPSNPVDVRAHTKFEYDQHRDVHQATGPLIYAQRNITGHIYLIRAWSKTSDFTGPARAQLYVTARFDDWAFLDRAHSNGRRVSLTEIDRDVSCASRRCTVSETVGINLTMTQLEGLAAEPLFSVKISGRRGALVLDVPGDYFGGVLKAIKEGPVPKS